jgi:hypothetical protein
MSTLTLTVRQWRTIRALLQEDHPKTVFMLKAKMKAVLGFTVREHNDWQAGMSIRLDFYNERKYTMFMLKYSEYLRE